MSLYFKENGFLSDKGKKLVESFNSQLEALLNTTDVNSMSSGELYMLESNLAKEVGKSITERINLLQVKIEAGQGT